LLYEKKELQKDIVESSIERKKELQKDIVESSIESITDEEALLIVYSKLRPNEPATVSVAQLK